MFRRLVSNSTDPHQYHDEEEAPSDKSQIGSPSLRNYDRQRWQRLTIYVALSVAMIYCIYKPFEQRRLTANEGCGRSSDQRYVGFWHIGGNAQPTPLSRDEFVQKQVSEIRSMHLFNKCNDYDVTLNYVTRIQLSDETKAILAEDGRIHELPPTSIGEMEDEEEYFEFTTLMELHSYCKNLPEEEDPVVFYIHSKTHDKWRRFMEDYVLGPVCVECLENPEFMACGPSLVTDDWIWQHFSGNFFMTRCQHVRTLNPPYTPNILDEVHTILNKSHGSATGFPHAFPPYGRYVAEYWLMNDAGDIPQHQKEAVKFPHLRIENEGHHESLISRDKICTRQVPQKIINSPMDPVPSEDEQ